MKAMIRIGAPSGFTSFSMALFMSVIVKLVAVYGTAVVALFGMAQKILRFGRMLVGGLGLGAGALVGQHLGAGRLERAWLTAVVSMRLGSGFLLVFGALVAGAAPILVSFFFRDEKLAGPGILYLRLMAIGLPFAGISVACENSFSGAGMNKPPMVVQIVTAWVLTVPAILLLGQGLDWGPPGAMLGIAIGEILGAMLSLGMLRRGAWLTHRI
jgi:Na+-driven multidrug efflux pump